MTGSAGARHSAVAAQDSYGATAAAAKIDAKMAAIAPGTTRWRALLALRNYRQSWVELGGMLNQIVYGGDYKEWGYDDFEVYCARELGIKKPTAAKLMISYNYMKRRRPETLRKIEDPAPGEEAVDVPDMRTVDLIDQARRKGVFDDAELDAIEEKVFADPSETAEADLRRELRTMLRPADPARDNALAKDRAERAPIIKCARELRRRMSGKAFIPEALRARIEQGCVELEALD